MTRTERLLRLARLRGDRAAVAILEGPSVIRLVAKHPNGDWEFRVQSWTTPIPESELRALWGDR